MSCAGRCPARTAASIRAAISPAISRRLASRDSVTSTSTGSARMAPCELALRQDVHGNRGDGCRSADDGPGAASAARRMAASSSRETSAMSSEIRSALEGNSGRRCRGDIGADRDRRDLHRDHAPIGGGIPRCRQNGAAPRPQGVSRTCWVRR